jgi:hypothetical protein
MSKKAEQGRVTTPVGAEIDLPGTLARALVETDKPKSTTSVATLPEVEADAAAVGEAGGVGPLTMIARRELKVIQKKRKQ